MDRQRGFSALIGLIFLIVVATLIFAAYIVVDNNSSPSANQNNNTERERIGKQESTDETIGTEKDADFYVIEQWGVKIALRDYDKVQFAVVDEPGKIDSYNSYDGYAEPTFKSKFLQDETCEPGLSLFRSKTKPPHYKTAKKVGEYYYFVTGGPGSCSDDPVNNPDDRLKERFLDDFNPDNITSI